MFGFIIRLIKSQWPTVILFKIKVAQHDSVNPIVKPNKQWNL